MKTITVNNSYLLQFQTQGTLFIAKGVQFGNRLLNEVRETLDKTRSIQGTVPAHAERLHDLNNVITFSAATCP